MCGGVVVDTHGQTNISNLYAIGEVSCTGLHGANRLASNSLLEGAVYSYRAANHIKVAMEAGQTAPFDGPLPDWQLHGAREPDEVVIIDHAWNELRHMMWNYVGIVRSDRRLERARRRIDLLKQEIHDYYWSYLITSDLIELRNLVLVAGTRDPFGANA